MRRRALRCATSRASSCVSQALSVPMCEVGEHAGDESVSDAKAPPHVLRTFELVEYRDRIVFEADEALAVRVEEHSLVGRAVAPGALAGPDLDGGAQERPVESLGL